MTLPAERLRQELSAARLRGLGFPDAWPIAVEAAAASSGKAGEWIEAFGATRRSWAAAYDGAPAKRAEAALSLLAFDRVLADTDGRYCERCGLPVAASRGPLAKYCTYACQRAAHGKRAIAA